MKYSPHLSHIRSFEVAARHLSFTIAAAELNYTQSAVSNHVRCLEDFIGRPLFVRHTRSLSLTNLGEAYLPSVQQALKQIDNATESIVFSNHEKKVVVSCPISLAENWLPKCISAFYKDHAGIDITVHGTIWTDVEPKVADIRITIDHQENAPTEAQLMWVEKLTIVCAPDYQVQGSPIATPQDLLNANLIHILGRPIYWQKIIDLFDLKGMHIEGGLQTNASNVALEFASQGLGCCALPKSLVQSYVARGLLIEPLEIDIECPWTYYLSNEDPSMTASVKSFRNWLTDYKQ